MQANQTTRRDILALGSETPVINHSPLPEYDYDHLDYGMTIGIERTRGGRLFSCWVGGGDNPKAFFVLAMSEDDGKSWGEPCLVIDPHREGLPYERCTIVGNLWLDPLGRLWLFFNQTLGHFDGASSNWFIRCDDPDAQTPVWSEPQYLWYGCTLNKPIVRTGGEWLLPVSLWGRQHISPEFREEWHELDALRGANVFASRDHGATWERRGCVVFPDSHFDEHMLVELSDGRLRMLARTAKGIFESYSSDAGRSWSVPEFSGIAHLSARFTFRKLLSGNILLVKHGSEIGSLTPRRCDLTAFLSADDGRTWRGGLLIDGRAEVSYPDATQSPEGVIYLQYDYNRAAAGHILLAKITEEDILAGKLVTDGSCLGQVVSIPFGLAANAGLRSGR